MLANKLKSALIATVAAGALLLGPGVMTASAGPVTATWNPSGSSPVLSTEGPFSFNNITTQDFSAIYLNITNGTGSENGFLPLVAFNNPGPQFIAGLDGNPGATAFGLYLKFTASFSFNCASAGNCTGQFTAVNYQLMADPLYNTTFGFSPANGQAAATDATANDFELAHGILDICGACQNTVTLSNSVPSAAVSLTFVEDQPAQAGFFVAPPAFLTLDLFGSFINNTNEVTCYGLAATCSGPGVTYGGAAFAGGPAGATNLLQLGNPTPGGGSLTLNALEVPEPATLAMFGFGLLGLGLFRGRRSQKV